MARPPLCVALDDRDPSRNVAIARAVAGSVSHVKVGLTSFTSGGAALATELSAVASLFVDLKLHDIPVQVERAVANVAALGASLTTVHASGGSDMIKAAVAGGAPNLDVVAVTVLTSLDDTMVGRLGWKGSARETVLRLAELALDAGAQGLVCSPLEVNAVRERFGAREAGGPLLVVPGVRPEGSEQGDQKRTLGPRETLDAGADLLVVGRPITGAPDPAAAATTIAGLLA